MDFKILAYEVFVTLISGALLTFIFFFLREKVFPLPDVSGRWYVEVKTINTAYKPYENMVLRFDVLLWCEGSNLRGTAEKAYEISSTGERKYVGADRVISDIDGFIEKKYLGTDRLVLHFTERGKLRESSSFQDINFYSDGSMSGMFTSNIADQDGSVTWQRQGY